MSRKTGTTFECERYECSHTVFGRDETEAQADADLLGWTRTEDGRDFCHFCTDIRAKRARVADLVPDGTQLYTAFDACEAAGFAKMYEDDEGQAQFYCCGKEVELAGGIFGSVGARCTICDTAVADVTGPAFKGATVRFMDSDKVDLEDACCWVVVNDIPVESVPSPDATGGPE